MKSIVLLLCCGTLITICSGRPQGNPEDQSATILKYENENLGIDGYKFDFETSNGIARNEEGTLQNAGSENEVMQVQGTYSYTDPKTNQKITVTFVADGDGFRPKTSIA